MDYTFGQIIVLILNLPWYYIPIVGILVGTVFNFIRKERRK